MRPLSTHAFFLSDKFGKYQHCHTDGFTFCQRFFRFHEGRVFGRMLFQNFDKDPLAVRFMVAMRKSSMLVSSNLVFFLYRMK
jgi:hypothetical protein